MLSIVPLGLIGIGIGTGYVAYQNHVDFMNKLKSEKIYIYAEQITNIDIKQNEKVIIKIPKNSINSKYLIGEILLEEPNPIKIYKEHDVVTYDDLLDEYVVKKRYYPKKIFKNIVIKKQILFPDIYPELKLNLTQEILLKQNNSCDKIVLFNNESTITSSDIQLLLDIYENDIKKNIPQYTSNDIFNTRQTEYFNLKKNYLSNNSDLFLLTEPMKNQIFDSNSNLIQNQTQFNIEKMSDSKNVILNEKFKNESCEVMSQVIISLSFLIVGILCVK